ncbi:MAG: hypothetical protein II367_00830 [Treponema sp.]|nr:hypothetical protein [Treponema sp.]
MKRIEIMMTQAIEVDFVKLYERACRVAEIKCKYTKIDNIMGQGNTNPKLGDAIWPQLNVMFILMIEDKYVGVIRNIMKNLHKTYVGEGAAAFISDVADVEEL